MIFCDAISVYGLRTKDGKLKLNVSRLKPSDSGILSAPFKHVFNLEEIYTEKIKPGQEISFTSSSHFDFYKNFFAAFECFIKILKKP